MTDLNKGGSGLRDGPLQKTKQKWVSILSGWREFNCKTEGRNKVDWGGCDGIAAFQNATVSKA